MLCLWLFCLSMHLLPSSTSAQLTSGSGSDSNSSSNLTITPISLSTAFLRILGALGLGGLIGLEREITNITRRLRGMAGIRTHAVICTGSCLIQLVSVYAYADVSGYSNSRDPSRLAAQAVSGIGFVGAGAILKGGENVIYGLTSAASIWLVMGVGLAIGVGYWPVACLTTALVVSAMLATKRAEHVVFGRRYGPGYTAEMEVVGKSGPDMLQRVTDCISKRLSITTISLERQQPQAGTGLPTCSSTASAPTGAFITFPSSSASSAEPAAHALLRARFAIESDNCSRQTFLHHLQLTVTLLCEDAEVYKVDSRCVQDATEGPTHRMEWNVPSQQEREQMDEEADSFKREVRQRRTREREEQTGSGGGLSVSPEEKIQLNVQER